MQQYHIALRQKDILDDRRGQLSVKLASATDIDARIKQQQEHLTRILSDFMDVIDILPPNSLGRTVIEMRHIDLAKYIIKNGSRTPNEKKWSCSRGLDKPIYTEPVPVSDFEIKTPKGATVKEKYTYIDEDYGAASAYLRAVLDKKPAVRGGRVVMHPRK